MMMCVIVNLTNKVQDTYLFANLKRQITQHLNLAKKLFIQQDDEMFELFVKSFSDLSWESTHSDLADSYESNHSSQRVFIPPFSNNPPL